MFYVKTRLDPETVIEVDITDENVFTRCPECGAEVQIDLNDMVDEGGQLDLYGVSVCCEVCSRKHWKRAHRIEGDD